MNPNYYKSLLRSQLSRVIARAQPRPSTAVSAALSPRSLSFKPAPRLSASAPTTTTTTTTTIMSSAKAIPVIVAGAREAMGENVAKALAPEIEMIHFIPRGAHKEEVPVLLRGEKPESAASSIGTGNFEAAPKAILLGGAFEDSDVQELRTLVAAGAAAAGKERLAIPWICIDSSKSHVPLGPEYAKDVASRCKNMIAQLGEEGKLEGNDDAIYRV